jgi:peptide/nickel transport system substrate-binding protein
MPQRRLATRRFLATVLFTDIVGSTSRAAELGDRAWREVLERHNAVVRRELRAFGGREMDTAGDGFFAVFETPERAVRCAESIVSAVVPLGLQIRAGVHTGECEVIAGKVGGMTVTIGARIAALADAGQVLVSRSVRDLMTGSGRTFEGGERQELKGVADRWRVYRLVADDTIGGEPSGRRPLVPLYTRRQRRRLLAVVAGVLVVLLAVVAGYLLTRPEPVLVVGENEVGVIGPAAQPRVRAAVDVGERPTAVASGFGSVWVTNSAADSVTRVDLETNDPVPINLESGAAPSGVAVGAGAVWVANSGDATVARIDPKTSRVKSISVRPGPTGIVVAFGSVWVTEALDASVARIDPGTNKVVHVVRVGASPSGIAAGSGYLWVTNQDDGTVTRFDPKTYERDSAIHVGSGPLGIALAGGAAWVANNLDGTLSRIDADDLSVASRTLAKGGGAYGVAAHGRDVWVSNESAGTLMRITASTFRLSATVPLRGAPLGLRYVGDDLWFTSAEGGGAVHRGGVLNIVGTSRLDPDDGASGTDPTLHYNYTYWRLAALTNDGLVGLRRAGGVQGAGIVPDLATTVPAPTEGGLTYTFHLRKGVRYSTGGPVLAGDIRRGIERTLTHPDSAGAGDYYAAIVGGQGCVDAANKALGRKQPRPDCDLSEGITTDDRTGSITFHLMRPDPEFLYRLALPMADAVPENTRVDLEPGAILPATGPYMIHSYNGTGLELVRNSRFHVWSAAAQPAGYPDQIVLELGLSNDEAVARVSDGRADLLWEGLSPVDADRLGTRYGSQLHTHPGTDTEYMYLNTSQPPFNNPDARQAVAYALDRRKISTAWSGPSAPVTCQVIPRDFAAYQPYCPFTFGGGADGQWTAPDVERAKALVRKSGTLGARVVLINWDAPGFKAPVARAASALRGLGYQVRVHWLRNEVPPDFATKHRDKWHAGLMDWFADYPAASNYLAPIGSCEPNVGTFNLSHYCNNEITEKIKKALGQQVSDPGAASDAWAAIDHLVVDAAAVIPFGTNVEEDFVSRRVGNVLVHPSRGPLIDQMWVQ